MLKKIMYAVFTILFISACKTETFPKPTGYLNLEYKNSMYRNIRTNCPFSFEINNQAKLSFNEKCWIKVKYPKLKATIDITYIPISKNLKTLFIEAEKLSTKHSIKADKISFIPYENRKQQVYGKVTNVTGNAASAIQFHVTDSTKHFLTGAVYFNVAPNYDSIYPAIKLLEKDVAHLVETLKWKQ